LQFYEDVLFYIAASIGHLTLQWCANTCFCHQAVYWGTEQRAAGKVTGGWQWHPSTGFVTKLTGLITLRWGSVPAPMYLPTCLIVLCIRSLSYADCVLFVVCVRWFSWDAGLQWTDARCFSSYCTSTESSKQQASALRLWLYI